MSFSVSGGQLPLTAFFGGRSVQKRKSTEPRVAATHKDPSESRRDAGPSTKRKRQKENHTPRASSSRKAGSSQSTSSRVQGETVAIDLTRDSVEQDNDFHLHEDDSSHHSPNVRAIAPTSSELPPVTPTAHPRSRTTLAAASLPSPPPTAPSVKRARRVRDDTNETNDSSLAGTRVSHSDHGFSMHADASVTSECITAQVVGNKDAIVLRSPQKGRGATMLPPPLPPKASSSTMPRPLLRPPCSSSSDRWVPSSQTQELSIPGNSQKHADVPYTPVDQMTQVVPSSQSHEREMRMSDVIPPMSDIYKTSSSPLRRNSLPVSPLLPDSDEGVQPPSGYFAMGQSSPHFVQSSQSQSEHDLTSSWAEMLGIRQAALARAVQGDTIDLSLSSPPRPAESQDYDAQDEYSQSQDANSQPSTFASPDPRTSPLHVASQYTDASSSSLPPYPQTPTQFREFLSMFDGRDEFGNELPVADGAVGHTAGRSRSVSPLPASRQIARLDGPSSESSPASHAHGSPHPEQGDVEDGQDMLDVVMESSQSQSYTGDSDYSSASSFPHEVPSAVRNFVGMFPD